MRKQNSVNIMKKIFLSLLTMVLAVTIQAQTITIVSPEGLMEPYEVAPGTEVTFSFSHFGAPPTNIITHNVEPVMPDWGLDPAWTLSTDYVDNGDETYSFTVTIDEELWVWSGYYQSFLSMWSFSNMMHFQIASEVQISFEDGIVCGDGVGIETLTVDGEFDSYQWFLNGNPIDGAVSNVYNATEAGAYKVQVLLETVPTFSNTLHVVEPEMLLSGTYIAGNSAVDMSASAGFDSYQWLSGSDVENLTEINGHTSATYSASLQEDVVYYAVSGTTDGCTVTSEARPISLEAFATPVIVISADTNTYGNVCEGTEITLSVNEVYAGYTWFRDGYEYWQQGSSISFSQDWDAGEYSVAVTPNGWPEISLVSDAVEATYFEVAQPTLLADVTGPYCPGQEINIILGDDGYDYAWYLHTSSQFTEDDLIENDNIFLTHTFENTIRVTVVATHEGCTSSRSLQLNSATSSTPTISFVDWNHEYLCTDSTSVLEVASWSVDNFENYQWYKMVGEEEQILTGETSTSISVTETGVYFVKADLLACEGVEVQSSTREIVSYTERELNVWADMEEICLGDETTLNISGGDSWQNIQWFRQEIEMGQSGYAKVLTPMIDGIDQPSVAVSEFTGYVARARHVSCPTGQKISSEIVNIRPSVNPNITVDPDYGINNWHLALYDSIPSYLYCNGEPVSVSVPDEYESYSWHLQTYAGDDDYELGPEMPGATGSSTTVLATGADWVTAKVELDGCVGVSDPVLIDTWVFSLPAIVSYNNSELCGIGDSTLLHNAFPGNYAYFEWYLNGVLIPNSNNDTIWAKEVGVYTLTIYREECPQFGLSSGTGPYVSILQASILENDTVIYAIPELGTYYYQWYLNGEPIESPANTPWVLYKDEMEDGIYTVEVSNPGGCVSLSGPYVWDTTDLADILNEKFYVHPNPTSGSITLEGLSDNQIESIRIVTIEGKIVIPSQKLQTKNIDLTNLDPGIYVLEVVLRDNGKLTRKIVRVQ